MAILGMLKTEREASNSGSEKVYPVRSGVVTLCAGMVATLNGDFLSRVLAANIAYAQLLAQLASKPRYGVVCTDTVGIEAATLDSRWGSDTLACNESVPLVSTIGAKTRARPNKLLAAVEENWLAGLGVAEECGFSICGSGYGCVCIGGPHVVADMGVQSGLVCVDGDIRASSSVFRAHYIDAHRCNNCGRVFCKCYVCGPSTGSERGYNKSYIHGGNQHTIVGQVGKQVSTPVLRGLVRCGLCGRPSCKCNFDGGGETKLTIELGNDVKRCSICGKSWCGGHYSPQEHERGNARLNHPKAAPPDPDTNDCAVCGYSTEHCTCK